MIRSLLALCALMLLLGGCVNKRGISATYYNDCREYYDMHGYYHKKCDENLIEYQEVKETVKEALHEEDPADADRKVW